MFYVSEIKTTAPDHFKTPLQEKTYQALEKLHIPFQRVDTDEAVTMEDCVEINRKLDMKMVKTLFLCNRQKTKFYLFVTAGDKSFNSKSFSRALDVPRVSFAPKEMMEPMLGTTIGAATIFSCLADPDHRIQFVIDRDVLEEEFYGCSDGTTTGYMKIPTADVCDKLLPFSGRELQII